MLRRDTLAMTLASIALLAGALPAAAQSQEDRRSRLGIGEIQVLPSLKRQLDQEGKDLMVGRIVEAMEPQLIDRLHNSRKFRIIARGDLKQIIDEQNLAPLLDPDTAPETLRISGIDYLVEVAVDHFEDRTETFRAPGRDLDAIRRTIEIGVVAKLWNTETGELLESANWELGSDDDDLDLPADIRTNLRRGSYGGDGEALNRLLRRMGEVTAQRVSNRVVDVIYPAMVVAVQGKEVFINRGDGTDINSGDVWTIYALGAEMIDPSTGISLGRTETEINKIKIIRIMPMAAVGEIVGGQDFGIQAGQVLRREQSKK